MRSRLLQGRDVGLGHRVRDVIAEGGERIYTKMPASAILWAGNDTGPRDLASYLDLPLVNGDVAALTRFINCDRYVALIRPDHIVGAIADPRPTGALPVHRSAGPSHTLAVKRLTRRKLVEPMTCAPNGFRSVDGLLELDPGQTVTTRWGVHSD